MKKKKTRKARDSQWGGSGDAAAATATENEDEGSSKGKGSEGDRLASKQERLKKQEQIVSTWLFKFYIYYVRYIVQPFYAFTIEGQENLPIDPDEPILFVSFHSYHSCEILWGLIALYQLRQKVVIALLHRVLIFFLFPLRKVGCIPGHRSDAIHYLKQGHYVAVIPGGAEEGVQGFENAYTINWQSSSGRKRRGFAQVAHAAQCRVIPLAGKRTQEMFFNPVAYLWNRCGCSHWYTTYLVSLPGTWGWLFWQIELFVWLNWNALTSVPVPVKAGLVIGPPLAFQRGESIDDFAHRVELALKELTQEANPTGLSYFKGMQERFPGFTRWLKARFNHQV